MTDRWRSYINSCPSTKDIDAEAFVSYVNENSRNIKSLKDVDTGIAVVISAYNEQSRLPRTLASVNNAIGMSCANVIVVDNASTDQTGLIASEFGAIVVEENKKGISFARQAGLCATSSHHEVIMTTDADAIVPEEWVMTLSQAFLGNQALVYGRIRYRPDDDFSVRREIGLTIFNSGASLFRKIRENKGMLLPTSCNMAFNRSLALSVGGYEVGVNKGEEQLLSNKLGRLGSVSVLSDLVVETSDRRLAGVGFLNHTFARTYRNVQNLLTGNGMTGTKYSDFR